jgi:hypothetical protein
MTDIPVFYTRWINPGPQFFAPYPPMLAASVVVGDSASSELTVTATGIAAGSQVDIIEPAVVCLQARQSSRELGDHGWPDVFGIQVLTWEVRPQGDITLTFQVKRLDDSGGWGQHLQVDILMVFYTPGAPAS